MFGLLFEQEIFGKSFENLRKSFYDRFYNIERNEKTNSSTTPRRHRFLIDFQKIFLDFCAKRIK